MTEVSTRPQVGATKAPTRPKKASSPAPEPIAQATPEAPISDYERTVAVMAAEQLQGIYDDHWSDLGVHASSLLLTAVRGLSAIQDYCGEVDRGDVFHHAAAAVSGALAIIRTRQPNGSAIGPLEAVFQTLESADISYGFTQDPCEALATGIRAGAQAPKVPRVDPVPKHDDLRVAMNAIAAQASTLGAFLWQKKDAAEANHDLRAANDFLVARSISDFIGCIADECTGSSFIGGALEWASGGAA